MNLLVVLTLLVYLFVVLGFFGVFTCLESIKADIADLKSDLENYHFGLFCDFKEIRDTQEAAQDSLDWLCGDLDVDEEDGEKDPFVSVVDTAGVADTELFIDLSIPFLPAEAVTAVDPEEKTNILEKMERDLAVAIADFAFKKAMGRE